MNRSTLACALTLTLVSACASATQKRADTAFQRGDFIAAADLYDNAVREKPTSEKLVAKRWEARAKAVEELASRAKQRRAAGDVHGALSAIHATADARKRWFSDTDAARLSKAVHEQVEQLSAWAVEVVTQSVRNELQAQRPLAARSALTAGRAQFQLAGLEARADALMAEVSHAGLMRCTDLTARLGEGGAHVSYWVAAYCRAFSGPVPEVKADPQQVGALKIELDSLAPTTPEQRELLERHIEDFLLASAWYHPQAEAMAALRISGAHTATFSQHPEKRQVNWVEKVPYQVQESYQESYTEYEHYMDREAYTQYRTESYSCGYGTTSRTCTRSVPTTQYRTVSKTRPVTKYRTKYRTVTRYREEPRVFNYEVMRHEGAYKANWDIILTLAPSLVPMEVHVLGDTHSAGDEHQVTFQPAAVAPAAPNLMSHDAWFADRLKQLDQGFPGLLRRHWVDVHCAGEIAGVEQAARCARGAWGETPQPARQVLSGFLKDDAGLLL